MPNKANTARRTGLGLMMICYAGLIGCGDSADVQRASGNGPPALTAAECKTATLSALSTDGSVVPSAAQIQSWTEQVEQFDGGFRPTGSAAEWGYIDQLASELQAMGASDVQKEAYTFPQWTPQAVALSVLNGSVETTIPIAGYMPYSGNTGAAGVQGSLVYLPGLSLFDLTGALTALQQSQNPIDALGQLLAQLTDLVGSLVAGAIPLVDYLLTHDLKGRVVVYDLPHLTIPAGVFEALGLYTNNSGGTLGPLTPYSRPYIDMMLVNGINSAFKKAGAAAVIGVIDYPAEEADGSYYPFFGLEENQTLPGVYVDNATGAQLKQLASVVQLQARVTLAAQQTMGSSYNLTAVIPGLCPQQILVGSHVDGTNAMEDDGPAAVLAIARYFLTVPQAQRLRGLRIVLTSGHFVGSVGINQYIQQHQADLTGKVLAAIEMEHLGAREWLELSPGAMGLDGLVEPQLLMVEPKTPLAQEAVKFARQFDRSLVLPPILPVGEGVAWSGNAKLPTLNFISGPVYLLNDNMPQASSDFIDYALMHEQVASFIQVIHDLNTMPVQSLRPDLDSSH